MISKQKHTMDYEAYISAGYKAVKKLFKKGDLQNAKIACDELLKIDPYNKKLLKLQEKTEKEILEVNLKKVKAEIKRTRHLWNEKRYEELLQIYNRLYEYAPQYKELTELIQQAEAKLSDQERQRRKAFIDEAVNTIKKVFEGKRLGETMQACGELLVIDPRNQEVKSILQKAKNALIDEKLQENERIVDSGDYERSLELYESLLQINPQSEKLLNMIKDAEQHITEKKKLVRRIRMNEGVKRIKDLFSEREYEKVLQMCEDLLQIDPKNFTAHLYQKKAQDTIEEEIDAAIAKKMESDFTAMKAEFEKGREGFVKI